MRVQNPRLAKNHLGKPAGVHAPAPSSRIVQEPVKITARQVGGSSRIVPLGTLSLKARQIDNKVQHSKVLRPSDNQSDNSQVRM